MDYRVLYKQYDLHFEKSFFPIEMLEYLQAHVGILLDIFVQLIILFM